MAIYHAGFLATDSLAVACPAAGLAAADEQAAIVRDRAQLPTVGSPDAQNGIEITSSELCEAGTVVHMRDAGGTSRECIGDSDGAVGDRLSGAGPLAGAHPRRMVRRARPLRAAAP